MKFIVDAQLPRRLALELAASGHDAVHTLDLPAGNHTQDKDIVAVAVRENRIVMTKDKDFLTSFLLNGMPPKLLLISTGNISNDALSKIVSANMATFVAAFAKHDFIELNASAITIHA